MPIYMWGIYGHVWLYIPHGIYLKKLVLISGAVQTHHVGRGRIESEHL